MTPDEARSIRDTLMEEIFADPDVEFGEVTRRTEDGVEGIWIDVDGRTAYLGASVAAARVTAETCDWWIVKRDGPLTSDDVERFEQRAELGPNWKEHEIPYFEEERRLRRSGNVEFATDGRPTLKPVEIVIHRGAKEVGGSCVEVRCDGSRLILDLGMPLFDAEREPLDSFQLRRAGKAELIESGIIPDVPGLFDDGPAPEAILLSHAHLDHTGLLDHSNADIPVYASKGTSKMMLAGGVFAAGVELPKERFRELKPQEPVDIGPFRVTGYPVDHSIYGCMAFLIEVECRTILYTGDVRMHGRKPGMMNSLVEELKYTYINAMLMEGTHFGFPDGHEATEYELEREIRNHIADAEKLVLMSFSPQHVDRLVGFIRAVKASGRTFVADVYTTFILHLLSGELNVPTPEPNGLVRMYVPNNLRNRKGHGSRKTIERYKASEITLDEIRKNPEQFAMVFRPSMADDFGPSMPSGSLCLYSAWHGYLQKPDWISTRQKIEAAGGTTKIVHTTGHIRSDDIVEFVTSFEPRTIVPIHTFEPQAFADHFSNVKILGDGEPFTI